MVFIPPECKFARYNNFMLTPTEKIWHNGRFIKWDDAKIHVLSHVVSYGSSVFEGIRCYETVAGPAIFRLREHVRRLLDSAKIYRIDVGFSMDQLCDAMVELVGVNNLQSCYLRPIVLRGYGDIGVHGTKCPTEVYLACWEWGKYLGEEALASGVDVCISSWNRIAPNTLPALAKAGANYMNSQLIRMEAQVNGYAEGIALDSNGFISEGSGENVFVGLYDITDYDAKILDAWEGADNHLYRKVRVRVATLDGEALAWTYVLDGFEGGMPAARYLGVLADAAEKAGAPDDYVAELRNRPCRSSGS